jgi:Ca-activated chloride channel homolog
LTLRSASSYNLTVRSVIRTALFLAGAGLAVGILLAQQPSSSPPTQVPATPTTQAPAPQEQTPKPQQHLPTISVSTNLVHLVATVADRRHKFITDLDEKDFQVLEDGRPQKIQFFSRETDLPLRIGVLLDTSNSIRPRFRFEQDAAIDFLGSVIRRGKDMAFLMTFDNEPEVIQDYTEDVGVLADAIQRQRAGGGTALRDAVCLAADKLSVAPPPPGPKAEMRRVMVVISDGEDNLSDHAQSETIEAVEKVEASIYSISTSTDWLAIGGDQPKKYHKTHGDEVLAQLSDQTGGRVFFPYKIDDLAENFLDIGTELRSQYFIAYAPDNPTLNGRYRIISVQVGRKGFIVRTRKGYYASANSMPSPRPSGQ